MKIKELIELLEQENPERIVVVSKDAEGNGFSVLSGFDRMAYKDGEVGIERLTEELRGRGYSEEDVLKGRKAIVIYPS